MMKNRILTMLEFYPQIKQAHVMLALLSGTVFSVRGIAALMNGEWQQRRPVKLLSYAIDIALLTAALILLTLLPWTMFGNGWLVMKLILLVVYVTLGVYTLRLARNPRLRAICYVLALLVFGWMVTIARAHHPLGLFRAFMS
jgi:uncharacterized membrane protein SirB2